MLDEGCVRALLSGSAPEGCPRHQYDGGWGYESGGFSADPAGPGWEPGAGCCAPPCPSHLLALHGVSPRLAALRLLHAGWRWYQPDIGRFIQRDPLGIEGGLNAYLYGGANPLKLVDPGGLADEDHESWWGTFKRFVKQVGKKAGSIVKKIVQKLTGKPGPKVGLGHAQPFVEGAKTLPYIARIHACVTVRNVALREGDLDENLDEYEKKRKRVISSP